MTRAIIVGAGPAGIAAAATLLTLPIEVTLLDEAARPGGQVYRSPGPGLRLDMRQLLGAGYRAYQDFHALAQATCARADYRPDTLVWSVHGGEVHTVSGEAMDALPYDALILATGATDRIMPLAGWTLPGVFTLGAAQVLLKSQGCLIGHRTVFCGSSPLLYLAAWQYLRAGGEVAAVLDTTGFAGKLRAAPGMGSAPELLGQGLALMAALKIKGVPIVHGTRIDRFEGEERLSGVVYRTARGAPRRIPCDAAAYGHGLRPEAQLAELAGCDLRYDPAHRLYFPAIDAEGRLSGSIYAAGDGACIGGARAAALSGTIAAKAALRDLGLVPASRQSARELRALTRLRRFQHGLARAFAWPHESGASLPDEVVLCRCEAVTVGQVRSALRLPVGPTEPNRVKAATRCGMGRCQGRFCGPALAEIVAAANPTAPPGRLRAQTPIKPLPIGAVVAAVAAP